MRAIEYRYDASDQKVAEYVDTTAPFDMANASAKWFIYDGASVVLDYVDTDGHGVGNVPTLDKRYFQGPGVDQLLAQENVTQSTLASNRVWWVLPDHLGSTRDLVTGGGIGLTVGTVIAHFQFDSFGNILDGRENVTRYQFTGREHDSNTDLNYHRARWYDPFSGKFASEDPISFTAGDPNITRMVGNNVLNATDPSGYGAVDNFLKSHLVQQAGYCVAKDIVVGVLPNGVSFHVTVGGCVEVVRCCENNDGKLAFKFVGSLEGYAKWGVDHRDIPYDRHPPTGGRKSKRPRDTVPDPWNPGKRIPRNRLKGLGQPAGPGFRDRDFHVDFGPGTPSCPSVPSYDVYGTFFMRGTFGVYYGGQFNVVKTVQTWNDVTSMEGLLSGWSAQVSAARGVYGMSVEVGVGVNLDIWFAKVSI